jgi:hypothetical protein
MGFLFTLFLAPNVTFGGTCGTGWKENGHSTEKCPEMGRTLSVNWIGLGSYIVRHH